MVPVLRWGAIDGTTEQVGQAVAALWWHPDDLAADGTAVDPDPPDVLRAAVRAVGGHP